MCYVESSQASRRETIISIIMHVQHNHIWSPERLSRKPEAAHAQPENNQSQGGLPPTTYIMEAGALEEETLTLDTQYSPVLTRELSYALTSKPLPEISLTPNSSNHSDDHPPASSHPTFPLAQFFFLQAPLSPPLAIQR